MRYPKHFLRRLLEDDDDEDTLKDILGSDFLKSDEPLFTGSVERFDRWANIKIGEVEFCISYLTPVAFYKPGEGITITAEYFSSTTSRHMTKWANYIGFNYRLAELRDKAKPITQRELTNYFKSMAEQVRWTKRQVKQAEKLPPIQYGLHDVPDWRIDVRAHQD